MAFDTEKALWINPSIMNEENRTRLFEPSNTERVRNLHTVFDQIGARGTYVNLFSTTSAKRSSSGQ